MPQEKFVKREFNNGHKTFISSEAKAFNEQLKAERTRREHFDAYKHNMIRDRNPLIGDPTPRIDVMTGVRVNQEPIINPDWIPRELPSTPHKHQFADKIGIETKKYHFLGNDYLSKGDTSSQMDGAMSRPLSTAGAAVMSSSPPYSPHQSARINSGKSSAPPSSRPGSDWKSRITEDGTLKPMIRFF